MEIFDIVDEKGIPTGETIERTQAHEKGVRHRTAHIWIVREQDGKVQLLLQKRSAEKDSFPGRFDTSSAGHIQAGDEPEESAIRELHEELGIRAAKEDLTFAGRFDIQYEKEFYGKMFRDNEVAFVYMYTKPVDAKKLTLQKGSGECGVVRYGGTGHRIAAAQRPKVLRPYGGLPDCKTMVGEQKIIKLSLQV